MQMRGLWIFVVAFAVTIALALGFTVPSAHAEGHLRFPIMNPHTHDVPYMKLSLQNFDDKIKDLSKIVNKWKPSGWTIEELLAHRGFCFRGDVRDAVIIIHRMVGTSGPSGISASSQVVGWHQRRRSPSSEEFKTYLNLSIDSDKSWRPILVAMSDKDFIASIQKDDCEHGSNLSAVMNWREASHSGDVLLIYRESSESTVRTRYRDFRPCP